MKKICVFTGTRADYGLLQPLMAEIKNDSDLDLKILVSGTHLSPEYGMTYKHIEADGYAIDEKSEILLSSDTSTGLCKSIGLGVIDYAGVLTRLEPELLVALGDRFEAFALVTAALACNIPVAHIHGGELTVGAMDDAFRHAISKMSHLHFTCTEEYRKRVIQLGEHPDRVFNVGGLGVENIKKLPLIPEPELKKQVGLAAQDQFFLVTFHPATLESHKTKNHLKNLFSALSHEKFKDFKIIITKANADKTGRTINHMIDTFIRQRTDQVVSFTSMGQIRYLSAMKYAAAVVGNSSSGILEAPAFKVPVVNIGKRQLGRICAGNVISCPCRVEDIISSIEKAISMAFKTSIQSMTNPFEKPGTARNIKNIIKTFDLEKITFKEFYDHE